MNKERRQDLHRVNSRLGELRDDISTLHGEVTRILEDEREAFEGMPESLQSSERGELAQAAIDQLEDVDSDLDSVLETLSEVENRLTDAAS